MEEELTFLEMVIGATGSFILTVEPTDDDPAPLSDTSAVRFMAKRNYSDEDNEAIITADQTDGITASGVQAIVTIDPDKTNSLDNIQQRLVWDCQVEKAGNKWTVDRGILLLKPQVVRA